MLTIEGTTDLTIHPHADDDSIDVEYDHSSSPPQAERYYFTSGGVVVRVNWDFDQIGLENTVFTFTIIADPKGVVSRTEWAPFGNGNDAQTEVITISDDILWVTELGIAPDHADSFEV